MDQNHPEIDDELIRAGPEDERMNDIEIDVDEIEEVVFNLFDDDDGSICRFGEFGSVLEPARPPKTDKSAILVDAFRVVTQLREEAQKLKDSNSSLQDEIKELKAPCYLLHV